MQSAEIRKTFLEFWKEKGHKIVPSAPIVVKNDPTLLFTNAGMNQFKDYFLGNKKPESPRIADTQKCLRVSGKHNDLEDVGIDTYHHTMFEMLGNWSFGDYFKQEALTWAWELLTDRYKLDPDRLYVTVFEGDQSEGLEPDTESLEIWQKYVKSQHILNGSKKDNFWEMGDTGPCGPCSEIHYDMRTDAERNEVPGAELVNNDHPQVIEIWNNVFIQFNRKADGSLEPLPAKHVDTGMGFERLVRVLQGKSSNYDTDVFTPLIQKIEQDFGIKYGTDEKKDIAFRVISDHIRAISFAIADGQLPSNTGAGYVIRRILRRAVRYAYSYLGAEEPYLHKLVAVLAKQFDGVFPELNAQQDFVSKVIREEEAGFLRTLSSGTRLFEKHISTLQPGSIISGEFAFQLYDTYGFPFDLTQLMARENGLKIDAEEFNRQLEIQKNRSRQASARTEGDWIIVNDFDGLPEFVGYDQTEAIVQLLRYKKVSEKGKTLYHLIFDRTPFYPEGGGQVGDTGTIENTATRKKLKIVNTFRENDLIIHAAESLPVEVSEEFYAVVDKSKRLDTARNHTATHLLHAALRKVLGDHVTQKGSLVNNEYLRFDFSHFTKMTDEEIAQVEMLVNEKIREDIHLHEDRQCPFDEAVSKGAMALFGEKYGDKVRVVTFDPAYSIELCGGTHAASSGMLGFFKITSESAIAAGVRRIEAVSGSAAETFINNKMEELKSIKESLKNPKDVISNIEALKNQNKHLAAQLEKFRIEQVQKLREELIKSATELNGIQIIAEKVDLPSADSGKNLVFELKTILPDTVVLLGAEIDDKANLWLNIPEKAIKEYGLNASQVIREISPEIEGGGGGQPFFASAGGKKPSGINKAIQRGIEIVKSKVTR